MKDELKQVKDDYLERKKRLALLDVGIDYGDVSTYVKYINATSNAEIKQQAVEIAEDIDQHNTADAYVDNRIWKPFG